MLRNRLFVLIALFTLAAVVANSYDGKPAGEANKGGKVSFSKQVQPVLQANCYGCHQPAKAKGNYQMTSRKGLLQGGESGSPAVVPGEAEKSHVLEMITPQGGKAEMPQGRPPLAAGDIELIRRWISEGAEDDSPKSNRPILDGDHPPIYSHGPVVASLDFSPDGTLLAVAGFHEAILWKSDGTARVARLVGMSDRIETVRFSGDGKKLLVVGGNPCRNGEIQVWDVAAHKLLGSAMVGFDTLYGGAWSPDGKLIAVGGGDNALRAFNAENFQQVVYMAAHDDWIRGTVFSGDGKSLFTASRDMTVKMTDVATQRFVGNLTTHTPGILRGGVQAIDRRPKRNEVIVGGANSAPSSSRWMSRRRRPTAEIPTRFATTKPCRAASMTYASMPTARGSSPRARSTARARSAAMKRTTESWPGSSTCRIRRSTRWLARPTARRWPRPGPTASCG